MWSYYGAKTNIVHLYPPPKYGKIIEPFAGTARYALKYWDREVLLVDKYDVIVKIWKWLQICSPSDILTLPKLKRGQKIDSLNICEEAKMFLGMNAGVSSIRPRNTISYFASIKNGRKNQFKIIANNLYKIKHWQIVNCDFTEIENQEATWFIDSPYQNGGHAYRFGEIDFEFLSKWSSERLGQAIVCENSKAQWMDFKKLVDHRGSKNVTTEVFWTNEPTSYGIKQSELFP